MKKQTTRAVWAPPRSRFRFQGAGFRVQGSGFRVQAFGHTRRGMCKLRGCVQQITSKHLNHGFVLLSTKAAAGVQMPKRWVWTAWSLALTEPRGLCRASGYQRFWLCLPRIFRLVSTWHADFAEHIRPPRQSLGGGHQKSIPPQDSCFQE